MNKNLLGLILVGVGLVLTIWGWDKNESTIAARTQGAVAMIVVGCISLAGGLGLWFSGWNAGKKNP